MKKTFVLIAICNLFIISAFGQEKSVFTGGVRAGFTASQISGDELSGWHKMGAYAGGFVKFTVSENRQWKLQGEINFIMKGSNKFITARKDGTIPNKYVLTLMYVEVPFFAKYQPVKWFEIEAAPALNVLFFAQEKDANGVMPGRQAFRPLEFSFIAGFSFIIKEHFGINVRWSTSVLPVRVPDGEHSQIRIRKKQYNDVIATSLYYEF